jgi:hypothetical protein
MINHLEQNPLKKEKQSKSTQNKTINNIASPIASLAVPKEINKKRIK